METGDSHVKIHLCGKFVLRSEVSSFYRLPEIIIDGFAIFGRLRHVLSGAVDPPKACFIAVFFRGTGSMLLAESAEVNQAVPVLRHHRVSEIAINESANLAERSASE